MVGLVDTKWNQVVTKLSIFWNDPPEGVPCMRRFKYPHQSSQMDGGYLRPGSWLQYPPRVSLMAGQAPPAL